MHNIDGIFFNNINKDLEDVRKCIDEHSNKYRSAFLVNDKLEKFCNDSVFNNTIIEEPVATYVKESDCISLETVKTYLNNSFQLTNDMFENIKNIPNNWKRDSELVFSQFNFFESLKDKNSSNLDLGLTPEEVAMQDLLNFYSTELMNIDFKFANMTREKALEEAAKSPYLEELQSIPGKVVVSRGWFKTDIPYVTKGANKILEKIADELADKLGGGLVITSALATGGKYANSKNSPHSSRNKVYASHFNANNPKIDISLPPRYRSCDKNEAKKKAKEFANLLADTGYVNIEACHESHICIQIKPEWFKIILQQELCA